MAVGTGIAGRHEQTGADSLWSSEVLESALLRIANRFADPGPDGDLLNWRAPANVPDLAVWALLALNSKAFARLETESRRRALSRVPERGADTSPFGGMFAAEVMLAAMLATPQLSPEERRVLEEKVQDASQQAERWRLPVLTVLYAAGDTHLRTEVEALLVEKEGVEDGDTPSMVAMYLGQEPPEDLAGRAAHLMSRMVERDASPVVILIGLARLSLHGSPEHREACRQALMTLANKESVTADPTVKDLLHALGLEATKNA
jgi:hypothetical protein